MFILSFFKRSMLLVYSLIFPCHFANYWFHKKQQFIWRKLCQIPTREQAYY